MAVSETPYHKTVYEAETFPENINEDFVQDSKETVQTLIICLSLVGLVLDIVVWRKSQFGLLIYPLEVIMLLSIGLMPLEFGFLGDIVGMMAASFIYLVYAVPTKINTVIGILSFLTF